jgi:phosphate starvation-inducible protein PhoH and related proteins
MATLAELPATLHAQDLLLEPADNERLAKLCGPLDRHLRQIEDRLGVEISNRSNQFRVTGEPGPVGTATTVLEALYRATRDEDLAPARVHLFLQEANAATAVVDPQSVEPLESVAIRTRRGVIRPRGPTQQQYLRHILTHDLNFGVGPAGTGKTYLAVACAVEALEREQVRRLVLVRPAVEAGERLGFLPGDLVQKVDPYLRPLYDALYEMLGFERVGKLLERNVIEIAPLAFMRGRTLNESFIILDEAQNTTVEQMKMFLTRLGFGSTAVITGDLTQIDLPRNLDSGLKQALTVLDGVKGISVTRFSSRDVVRHPLVQRIVDAYEHFDRQQDATP